MEIAVKATTKLYTSDVYSLNNLAWRDNGVEIVMHVKSKVLEDIYTGHYTNTVAVLESYMPSVFRTKCFNDGNKTFREEVKNTELGHLFEHILIQKLSELQKSKGIHKIYDGVTSWDWKKTPYGTFSIFIDSTAGDSEDLNVSLQQTIELFNKIVVK